MLDANLKTQLKTYLEKVSRPIEIVASLDDSKASDEVLSLLKDVAESSPLVKLTEWGRLWKVARPPPGCSG